MALGGTAMALDPRETGEDLSPVTPAKVCSTGTNSAESSSGPLPFVDAMPVTGVGVGKDAEVRDKHGEEVMRNARRNPETGAVGEFPKLLSQGVLRGVPPRANKKRIARRTTFPFHESSLERIEEEQPLAPQALESLFNDAELDASSSTSTPSRNRQKRLGAHQAADLCRCLLRDVVIVMQRIDQLELSVQNNARDTKELRNHIHAQLTGLKSREETRQGICSAFAQTIQAQAAMVRAGGDANEAVKAPTLPSVSSDKVTEAIVLASWEALSQDLMELHQQLADSLTDCRNKATDEIRAQREEIGQGVTEIGHEITSISGTLKEDMRQNVSEALEKLKDSSREFSERNAEIREELANICEKMQTEFRKEMADVTLTCTMQQTELNQTLTRLCDRLMGKVCVEVQAKWRGLDQSEDWCDELRKLCKEIPGSDHGVHGDTSKQCTEPCKEVGQTHQEQMVRNDEFGDIVVEYHEGTAKGSQFMLEPMRDVTEGGHISQQFWSQSVNCSNPTFQHHGIGQVSASDCSPACDQSNDWRHRSTTTSNTEPGGLSLRTLICGGCITSKTVLTKDDEDLVCSPSQTSRHMVPRHADRTSEVKPFGLFSRCSDTEAEAFNPKSQVGEGKLSAHGGHCHRAGTLLDSQGTQIVETMLDGASLSAAVEDQVMPQSQLACSAFDQCRKTELAKAAATAAAAAAAAVASAIRTIEGHTTGMRSRSPPTAMRQQRLTPRPTGCVR